MSSQLRGTGVALVTPFDKENDVDYPALKKLVAHCIKGSQFTYSFRYYRRDAYVN